MLSNQRRRMALLLGLAALLFVLAACRGNQPATGTETDIELPAAPAQTADADEAQPAAPADLTQSAEAGAVTVQVTPLNLHELQVAALDFQIVMDTHSVDLDVDLAQTAVLRVDDQEIAANEWQAPAGGGHHVEGTLSFPAVDDSGRRWLDGATAVTLTIRDLAGVAERAFSWDMATITGAGAMPMGGAAGRIIATVLADTFPGQVGEAAVRCVCLPSLPVGRGCPGQIVQDVPYLTFS